MYWCKKYQVPSLGRGAAACVVAGRGNNQAKLTPTSTFPKEGIAQGRAFKFLLLILVGIFFFPACKPAIKEDVTAKYFDLKAYFKADSARLSRLNKPVRKTVTHNGVTETKEIKIADWSRELSLFSESDINKPAWRDSYKIQTTPTMMIYTATDDDLKTREIIVNKTGDKVKYIVIYNYTKNILYYTKEKLTYWPDSLYKIEKTQQVRLLGLNKYVITGTLN